jgi:5-methylcytosine-specific restriction endonuclease McrA
MADRKRRNAKTRLRIFLAHNGTCHVCGGKISVGEAWDLDHVIPLALYGEDEEHNLAPAHRKGCHGGKTAEQDVPAIARAKRLEAAHLGIKRPSSLKGQGFKRYAPQRRATTPVEKLSLGYRRPVQ